MNRIKGLHASGMHGGGGGETERLKTREDGAGAGRGLLKCDGGNRDADDCSKPQTPESLAPVGAIAPT